MPYEKVGKNEPVCIADQMPFEIPESWEWVRLGSIFSIEMGQSPAGNTVSENNIGIEFHQGKMFFGDKYINLSGKYTSSPTKYAPKNSVLLCVRAPVGKVNITNRKLCIGRGLCAIIPLAGMPLLFVYYLLAAYENIFVKQATGTTFVAITAETVKNQLIPLPPFAEQIRIAEQIEKLIPVINEYRKVDDNIKKLNDCFPELLKKSILQEAVQGKLVPQDPTDEPASVLLERIRAEKERLIQEGKIKRDKHESVIYRRDNSHYEKLDGFERCIDDEIPFEIPETWEWVRLGTISTYSYTKQKINAQNADPKIWGLDLEDIEKGGRLLVKKSVVERKAVGDKTFFDKGDILYSKLRPYLLKILIAPDCGICTPEIVPFKVFGRINPEYIVIFLKCPYVDAVINSVTYGVKMPRVGTETMTSLFVPIPPLSEQCRIVEKQRELFDKISLI